VSLEHYAYGDTLLTIPSIPVGMKTVKFDIEEPSWDPLYRDCDLVHMRMLYGSIQTDLWPEMYRKAFA
jgi:hypothetical protein